MQTEKSKANFITLNEIEKHILKNYNLAENPARKSNASKPVQYYTLGKDNCLIHHPTSYSPKSSTNAIFYKTNPFKKQTSSRKVKFTLPSDKYTSPHTPAISKLSKSLKQAKALRGPDSDICSMIIEGKSVDLKPKEHVGLSFDSTFTYCKGVKHCKMCGEVMLGVDHLPSQADKQSSTFGSSSHLNKVVDVEHEIKTIQDSNKQNPILKRCAMCSQLFLQPCVSKVSKKCPNTERTKKSRFSTVLEAAIKQKQTLSATSPTNKTTSTTLGSQTNRIANSKTSQSATTLHKPVISNKDKFAQPKTDINKKTITSTDLGSKKSLHEKSNMYKTKSMINTSGQNTNSKGSVPNIASEHPKWKAVSNQTNKKARVDKSSIDSIAKALTEKNTNSKHSTEKLSVDSLLNKKQSHNKNLYTKQTVSKVANKPSGSLSKISIANPTDLRSTRNPEKFLSESFLNGYLSTNVTLKNKSFKKTTNVPSETQSMCEESQTITTSGSTSDNSSDICIDNEECINTNNIGNKKTTSKELNMATQNKSLTKTRENIEVNPIEEVLQESETNLENQEFSSLNGNSVKNSNKSKHKDKEATLDKSRYTLENVMAKRNHISREHFQKPNMTSKSTSTEKLNGTTNISSSQQELDFLSKCDKKLEGSPSSPIVQNVTVNNYYFISGSELQKALYNSSVSHNGKYLSSKNSSLVSEFDDELTVDKINESENNSENSSDFYQQSELIEPYLAKLFAKHRTRDIASDSCQLQSVISTDNALLDLNSIFSNERNIRNILKQKFLRNEIGQTICPSTGIKNPYIQKSLRIFEEMERVQNNPIDDEKILEDLKKNSDLMKMIDQMAYKKLNFSRKSTAFKNI